MTHVARRSVVVLVAVLGIGCGGSSDVAITSAGGSTGGPGGAGGTAIGGSGGAGGTTPSDASLLCIPGQSVACVGFAACQGGQACRADGLGYDPCLCGSAGAGGSGGGGGPSGGSGGAGGGPSGGSGGAGGSSGSSGGAGGADGGIAGGGGASGGTPTDGSAGSRPVPDGNGCGPLANNATDVYVDQRYTGANATGVAACPLPTITAGMAAAANLSGKRTVHVAGDTPALVYNEATRVLVGANVILQGDGPTKTTISASGAGAGGPCAVHVVGGGTLDGFTVVSPVAGSDGVRADTLTPAPVVKNVSAIGSKGNGIVALGAIELGPNIVASNNGGQGVAATGAVGVVVHVIAAGGANAFENNGANGIDVEGATLVFEGGLTASNGFNGIRFGLAGAPGATSTITGLVSKNNNTGISSFGGQNLKIRSSNLLANKIYGLLYNYAAGYTLDLGLPNDAGGNTFGGATAATRNPSAGIYLCKTTGPGTLPAGGDLFAVCPPTRTAVAVTAAGCAAPASYSDVAYGPTAAGDPVVAGSCAVGP